jgi:hypothetical protein
MPLFASGVGGYGSIGGVKGKGVIARPAAGNSNMMPAKTISAEPSVARQHTQNFVANGKQMARGAKGNSRIHVKG